MCENEKVINLGNEEDNNTFTQDIEHSFQAVLIDFPDVLDYIKRLQDCIIRQRRLILTLYEKRHDLTGVAEVTVKFCDASTQTSEDQFSWEQPECTSGSSIVDQVKEVAESAVRQTGFVYEATSGMYYDYHTGYYYNAELGLYYNGNSGAYYRYDEEKKEFQFHSSVNVTSSDNADPSSAPNIPSTTKRKDDENMEVVDNDSKSVKQNKPEGEKMDLEDGECSEDSDKIEKPGGEQGDLSEETGDKAPKTDDPIISSQFKPLPMKSSCLEDEIANSWPPCMRIIVQETDLENLSVGELFIVTCNGGSLGREGSHAVIVPDIKISKHHAKFTFSEEAKHYVIVDLGSRNGTFLNGNRLSVALQESEPHSIEHGDVLKVGSTHLLCHIHTGLETCQKCEPGCISNNTAVQEQEVQRQSEQRQESHRTELRRLRRKFGLEGPGAVSKKDSNTSNYKDRAEIRRKTVGSSDDSFKTEVASVHESIKCNNKGFKMLSKMGWSEGQALGKDSSVPASSTEPILVEQRRDKAGLGCSDSETPEPAVDKRSAKKKIIWKKTQKRYKNID